VALHIFGLELLTRPSGLILLRHLRLDTSHTTTREALFISGNLRRVREMDDSDSPKDTFPVHSRKSVIDADTRRASDTTITMLITQRRQTVEATFDR
jgi:hypothetical protein